MVKKPKCQTPVTGIGFRCPLEVFDIEGPRLRKAIPQCKYHGMLAGGFTMALELTTPLTALEQHFPETLYQFNLLISGWNTDNQQVNMRTLGTGSER
jgi:hypothetical protein